MVFRPDPIPPVSKPFDTGTSYELEPPFDLKQTVLTHRRHRWFDVRTIGTPQGPYAVAAGLNAGATQRLQFEHMPDFVIVTVSGQTANTGRVLVHIGNDGGPGILLGPTGSASVPGGQSGIVTLVNVGTTPTYGNVVALTGHQVQVQITPGL